MLSDTNEDQMLLQYGYLSDVYSIRSGTINRGILLKENKVYNKSMIDKIINKYC